MILLSSQASFYRASVSPYAFHLSERMIVFLRPILIVFVAQAKLKLLFIEEYGLCHAEGNFGLSLSAGWLTTINSGFSTRKACSHVQSTIIAKKKISSKGIP